MSTLPSISEKNKNYFKDNIFLHHGWAYEFVTGVPGDPPFVIIYRQVETHVLKRMFEAEIPAGSPDALHAAARKIILAEVEKETGS
jgi:hypothetical protein